MEPFEQDSQETHTILEQGDELLRTSRDLLAEIDLRLSPDAPASTAEDASA